TSGASRAHVRSGAARTLREPRESSRHARARLFRIALAPLVRVPPAQGGAGHRGVVMSALAMVPGFAVQALAALAAPAGPRARLSILLYHRVLADADPFDSWNVTATEFEGQVAALATHFNMLPLDEAVMRLRSKTLPARAACITFDDGYADNESVALSI